MQHLCRRVHLLHERFGYFWMQGGLFQHVSHVEWRAFMALLLFPAARIQIYNVIAELGQDVVIDIAAGFLVQLLHFKVGWMDG